MIYVYHTLLYRKVETFLNLIVPRMFSQTSGMYVTYRGS